MLPVNGTQHEARGQGTGHTVPEHREGRERWRIDLETRSREELK